MSASGKKKKTKTPFTAHASDKQTPWMALAQESGKVPDMTVDEDEGFMSPRARPDWDKNSGFIKRTTDVEVNQAMIQRMKILYESNTTVSNAVDIFLLEIWRGGLSITVHFGDREKMVFSKQDPMTKRYFSERLDMEIKAVLRDCVLYGFACVRVLPPEIVEVEVDEAVNDDPDAYVDEEAMKAAMPNNKEELLRLLDEEVRNGASFAGDTLQEKMDSEGSRLFDGEREMQVSNPIRRMKGSNQLVYEDPDPAARRALEKREAFYQQENTPSIESLKTQLLAIRLSNRAVEQLARGEGGGAYPEQDELEERTTGDDDLDSYPSFTVLDMNRVTQYIRINEQDRREYYVTYNGHGLNRKRGAVPQGMLVMLNEPTLDGIPQSAVAKVLPLASQLYNMRRDCQLVSYVLARPFLIATTETDKSDPHVASRTMTFGDAAQDGTEEAMKQYSQVVEIRRQQAQETHEILVDPRYEELVQQKKELRRRQAAEGGEGIQYSRLYPGGKYGNVHPLLDDTGAEDPTDLRDEPYLRKCVMPVNSRLLPNPVPTVLPNILDVDRYLCEQIFVAMGLPPEMYQGGQRKFAANQTLNQMIQDSRIQEFQNSMATLFQTLLSRVFDPLVDERIFNIATKGGFQTNPNRIKRYKSMASVLVEFHFNVHMSDEQLVLYADQGWLAEKDAQTFALRQVSIDPKFGEHDPSAARRKRMRDAAMDEEKPRMEMERAKIQSSEKIAAENRKSAERTAKANAAAKAAAPSSSSGGGKPTTKKQK